MYMGKSFSKSNGKEREGIYMISEQVRGDRINHRARIAQTIGAGIDPEVLRLAIRDWDERRAGMRESLPGDRRK